MAAPLSGGCLRGLAVGRPLRLAAALIVIAASLSAHPQDALPALDAPVNDFAKVIDSESAGLLDRRIRSLQATTGDAVVIVTVETVAPYASIEEYAVRLFEQAGIGSRANDNGLLVVVAVTDRQVRIEVGYGLEGAITDGFSGETIRRAMLPAFREGQYGAGLLAGSTQLIQRIAEDRGVTVPDMPPPQPQEAPGVSPELVRLLPIGILILILLMRMGGGGRRRRRRGPFSGWYGGVGRFGGGLGGFGGGLGGGFGGGGFGGRGGGFGGFGGFGGGRSGGGGASGRW